MLHQPSFAPKLCKSAPNKEILGVLPNKGIPIEHGIEISDALDNELRGTRSGYGTLSASEHVQAPFDKDVYNQ